MTSLNEQRGDGARPIVDIGAHTPSRKRRARADDLLIGAQDQMRILDALRANLTVHHETLDDPELMMVVAEGQTSLLEFLDALLEADADDESLIAALKRSKDTMAVRLHRFEERRQSRRVVLEQALLLLDRKSLERPTATITLSDRAASLVVEEEAQIPARFFDLRPVLNRRMAKEALEAGETFAGARLSTGVMTLTVRRR